MKDIIGAGAGAGAGYLDPSDTSFRQMIDNFMELSGEQKQKLINLTISLKDVAEAK